MKTLLQYAKLTVPAIALAVGSLQALAGTAEIKSGDGETMRYEYSGTKLRADLSQAGAYMIVRDGHVYMVTENNGQPMVIDANEAWNIVGSMAGSTTPAMMTQEFISLKPTGRTEQHAGLKGEVHILRYRDTKGREQETEIVLSGDPRARAFFDAMHRFAATMSEVTGEKEIAAGSNQMQQQLQAINKGVLRYGDDMIVTALTDDAVAEARFALPAEPTDMSGLSGIGAMFGGGGAAGGSGSGSSGMGGMGGIMDSVFGSKSESDTSADEGEEEEESGEAANPLGELGKTLGNIFGQ